MGAAAILVLVFRGMANRLNADCCHICSFTVEIPPDTVLNALLPVDILQLCCCCVLVMR